MGKLVVRKDATMIETIAFIKNHIMTLGISNVLVDEINDGVHWFAVYDKYYIRASNRVSLSINVYKRDKYVYVEAIAAAGGRGALINFSWGSESDFLQAFYELIIADGFIEVS